MAEGVGEVGARRREVAALAGDGSEVVQGERDGAGVVGGAGGGQGALVERLRPFEVVPVQGDEAESAQRLGTAGEVVGRLPQRERRGELLLGPIVVARVEREEAEALAGLGPERGGSRLGPGGGESGGERRPPLLVVAADAPEVPEAGSQPEGGGCVDARAAQVGPQVVELGIETVPWATVRSVRARYLIASAR